MQTSVTRLNVCPFGRLRCEATLTPSGEYSNFTSGIVFMVGVNCVPLKLPCRIGTWNGSTTFSQCWSQLHGTITAPPLPMLVSSVSRNSPSSITSRQS